VTERRRSRKRCKRIVGEMSAKMKVDVLIAHLEAI
jgi:hypothetical protein